MKTTTTPLLLAALAFVSIPAAAAVAPPKAPRVHGRTIGTFTATQAKPAKSGKDDQLSAATILQRLSKGQAGDWKFIAAGSGSLRSGRAVRMGSDYSGDCITNKTQKRGIDLGHVSNCSKTRGGKNVTFAKAVGDKSGSVIRYGDKVTFFVAGVSPQGYVCYGKRKHGINLEWSTNDSGCRSKGGSKGNGAQQWLLIPPSGSKFKVGDAVPLDGRFRLHNVVAGDAMVKCARLNGALTYRNGDLRWGNDCKDFETVVTHRGYLLKIGKDPKQLALSMVPSKYRSYVAAMF